MRRDDSTDCDAIYRAGIIGCGTVARGHAGAMAAAERWHLVAAADLDPARARAVADLAGAEHIFTDYRALLDRGGLDVVVVATHADTHAEITLAALRRGFHVLCEKPMARDADECRQMVAAARDAERFLVVNFNTRCGPAYRCLREQIAAGVTGPVRVVRFVYDWSNHHWTPPQRLEQFMAHGGPIVDSGVHFFDGVRWFTDAEFDRVEATGVFLPPHRHPQHVIASCRMTDGCVALVEAGWLYCKGTAGDGSIFQVTVIGDDATLDFDAARGSVRAYTAGGTTDVPIDPGKHFEVVYTLLAQSLDRGRLLDLACGEDGLRATEAAYAALASAHRQA